MSLSWRQGARTQFAEQFKVVNTSLAVLASAGVYHHQNYGQPLLQDTLLVVLRAYACCSTSRANDDPFSMTSNGHTSRAHNDLYLWLAGISQKHNLLVQKHTGIAVQAHGGLVAGPLPTGMLKAKDRSPESELLTPCTGASCV